MSEGRPVYLEAVPGHEVCDFCHANEPRWAFDCRDFEFPPRPPQWGGIVEGSSGAWAACDICRSLIELNNYRGLIDFVTWSVCRKQGGPVSDEDRRALKAWLLGVYLRFAIHRRGPAMPVAEVP